MELWIRSQDREEIVRAKRIYFIHNTFNCETIDYRVFADNVWVGSYTTKERTLEVLDEIQELIKPKIITTNYECECKDNPSNKLSFNLEVTPTKTEITELSTYVYEMPKE